VQTSLTVDRAEIERHKQRIGRAYLTAGRETIVETTRGLELDLESATKAVTRGKLYRAWGSKTFPRSGIARDPTGTVFVNGGERTQGAIRFQTTAGNIRPHGEILWIPLPAAGRRPNGMLTPQDWERAHGATLRLVQRPGHSPMLVLDEGRLAGKAQRGRLAGVRARAQGRTATIPIFVGMPSVSFSNNVASGPIIDRRGGRIAPDLLRRLQAIP
jgi:hypothetical protein